MNLPDLLGRVVIDNSRAKASLDEVKGKAVDLQSSMGKFDGSFSKAMDSSAASSMGLGKALGATALAVGGVIAATAAGVAAVRGMTSEFAKAGSELIDLKAKLGIGVLEIQKLGYVAKQSGVEFGSLETALMHMEKTAAKTPEKFSAIGIGIEEIRNSKPDELFRKVVDELLNVENANTRALRATEIFGRGGTEVLKMVTSEFKSLHDEAGKMGFMTDDMAVRADRLDDAYSKLDTAAKNLKISFQDALAAPVVVSAVEELAKFTSWAAENMKAIGALARMAGDEIRALKNSVMNLPNNLLGMVKGRGWSPIPDPGDTDAPRKPGVLPDMNWMADSVDKYAKKLEEEARAADRAAEANRHLFDQRSRSMGSATPIGGFDFWSPWAAGDKFIPNELPAGNPRNTYGLFSDPSKFLIDGIEKTLHIDPGPMKEAADSAERWAMGMAGVAMVVGVLPGRLGDSLNAMRNISESFKNWDAKDSKGNPLMSRNAKIGAVGLAVGQIGGLIGGAGGSFLQGAGGGAAAGAAFGPWGAAIGGVIGGITGLFGNSAAKKKELEGLRNELRDLQDEAKLLGIDLSAALSSKNANVLKSAIEQVNTAMEAREKRLDSLSKFSSGLNEYAKAGITDQAGMDRMGRYAAFTVGNQVRETGDIFGALDSVAPALEQMAKAAREMGLEIPKSVASLLQLQGLDPVIKSQVSGLNMMTKAYSESGYASQAMFNDLSADAVATKAKLEETGLSGAQSLALMQPSLQQIYEMQKRHGYAVDETTQALLDEAKAQGLVGDQMMSANERIVDLLGILIEAVGGRLPDAYRRAGDAADDYARRASNLPRVPGGGDQDTSGMTPEGEPHALGVGFRNWGSGTPVVLHGEEAVLRRDQFARAVDNAVSGMSTSGRGGSQVVYFGDVIVHAAPGADITEEVAREVRRAIVDGPVRTLLQDKFNLR